MNYAECLNYLDRLGNEVLQMKFGLETIRALLKDLGSPQGRFPSVLIAGTNAKGSVARFLASACHGSGLRTGLFTSPHLVRVEERVMVSARAVSPEQFAAAFSEVAAVIDRRPPPHATYFEMLTATAFVAFAGGGVELAVLEVGMGGRLDSTNVTEPLLSLITPIGLDHQRYLGETLQQIAVEKAGIMRAGRPVLTAPQRPEVLEVLQHEAHRLGAELIQLDEASLRTRGEREGCYSFSFHGQDCELGVFGSFQVENAALAIQAAEGLQHSGLLLTRQGIRRGIEAARMSGSLQRIGIHPPVFLDGGHNPDAARKVAEFLQQHTRRPRVLIFGIMRDKDIAGVLAQLKPEVDRVLLVPIQSPRAATPAELNSLLPEAVICSSVNEALTLASSQAETVVIAGSFYLVGEALKACSSS